jgi:anthranilate phosphoribosyltransferase
VKAYLERLTAGQDLDADEARQAMSVIMRGDATPVQIAGFLVALRVKGETPTEIAGFVRALREYVVAVRPNRTDLVDIVGTGGDGAGTINISTAAALVTAACGVGVAKHGNRAVSSAAGSADVLEALGVAIELDPVSVALLIDEVGFGFMFAPNHHPGFRFAGSVRRELGVRTVMNLLGPLTNPAFVPRAVIGVARPELVELFAAVVADLGTTRTLIVHGAYGVDELSPAGESILVDVTPTATSTILVSPEALGLDRCQPDALRGGSAADNAAAIRAVFDGGGGPLRDTIVLNAAAGLFAAGVAGSLADGVTRADQALTAGAVADTLDQLVARSNALAGAQAR